MIWRRCGRCGTRIQSGSTCKCIKEYNKQRHKVYDKFQRNKESTDFYHSKEWQITRSTVLDLDNHIDIYIYMTEGRIVPAEAVHHIIPLQEDWEKRCDVDNLISLSESSHSKIEQMYKTASKTSTQQMLREMVSKYRADK